MLVTLKYHFFHYLVSKVCVYDLAAGVTKMSFGELMQGNTTDVSLSKLL